MLTIAIQKSGRLSEQTINLFRESGINLANGGKEKLKSKATNFPIEFLYMRDDDIPQCVSDQIADLGIVGENVVHEKSFSLSVEERLGFARCRLAIAIPKDMEYKTPQDLQGLNFATSYPKILKNFLDENQIDGTIHEISGSVEIAPSIGMADVIFDIVSTGSTLLHNGLKEVHTVLNSEAVLISNGQLNSNQRSELERLLFRFRAVNKAQNYKYILLNIPNDKIDDICNILPGMKSPTVMPLAKSGWSSMHSVIREDDFWENIENLKAMGAQGILVIPIEKMII
ncbi:MAG: ATP phosphoribosyltransferase [Caldithrix sp.]|nr:ATP phosphoribosyltransferase [Caldithrix sp.]